MIICKSTARVYYPIPGRIPDLIRGSGRIRYIHGVLVVKSKGDAGSNESLHDSKHR